MRIAFVTRNFTYPLGGFEEHLFQLSKELTRLGNDVTIFTTTLFSETDECSHVNGIPVKKLPVTFHLLGYCYSPLLKRALTGTRSDVYHAQGWGNYAIDTSMRCAHTHSKPAVITPHGFFHEKRVLFIKHFYNTFLAKPLFTNGNFIALTRQQKAVLKKMGVKNIRYIPNGVDVKEFEQDCKNKVDSLVSPEKHIVLCVGRIAQYKGFETAIRALKTVSKSIKNVHLVLVGEDWGDLIRLKKLAASLQLMDRITFTGKITKSALIGLYQIASIFVSPSSFEGFGITLLEAMASELPVVSTPTGIASDMKNNISLFNFGKHEDLAHIIIDLLSDSNLAELGKKNKELVRKQFSWEKVAKQTLDFYQSVVEM